MGYTPFVMETFKATEAKKRVRNIITSRVKGLAKEGLAKKVKTRFVTLSGEDTTHEKKVAGEGIHIISINKSKKKSEYIQRRLSAQNIPNAKTMHCDIFDFIKVYDDGRTFVWFDFCDLANSWDNFFRCMRQTNFCKDSQVAVTFSATLRNYKNSHFLDRFFPHFKSRLEKSDNRPQMFAERIFNDCRGKMRSLGWRCSDALVYTVHAGKMVTIIFDRKKGSGAWKLKDITPKKRKKYQNKNVQVDKQKAIMVWQYAKKLGLSPNELSHAFRNPQTIAHITMAEKKLTSQAA